jgi:hypothetical protein
MANHNHPPELQMQATLLCLVLKQAQQMGLTKAEVKRMFSEEMIDRGYVILEEENAWLPHQPEIHKSNLLPIHA